MEVLDAFQWDADRVDDIFERPPYVVRFNAFDTGGSGSADYTCNYRRSVAFFLNFVLKQSKWGLILLGDPQIVIC